MNVLNTAQVLRFGVSGALAAAAYSMFFVVLGYLRLPPLMAGGLSYALSMPLAFVLHRRFSFRSKKPYQGEALRFFVVSTVGLASASVTPALLMTSYTLSLAFVALATSIVTPIITYLVMSLWVFGAGND